MRPTRSRLPIAEIARSLPVMPSSPRIRSSPLPTMPRVSRNWRPPASEHRGSGPGLFKAPGQISPFGRRGQELDPRATPHLPAQRRQPLRRAGPGGGDEPDAAQEIPALLPPSRQLGKGLSRRIRLQPPDGAAVPSRRPPRRPGALALPAPEPRPPAHARIHPACCRSSIRRLAGKPLFRGKAPRPRGRRPRSRTRS